MRTIEGNLGDAVPLVTGVTTLGGSVEFLDSMALDGADELFRVYDLVWCFFLTGYVSTSCTRAYGCLFYETFGAVVVACTGGLLIFFVKMAAKVVSAVILSSQIASKGTSRWGCFKVTVMS